MNYPESPKILEDINKAKKVLINLHRGPDGDSVGSALAIANQLKKLGKSVDVVLTSNSEISANLKIIPGVSDVKSVDFKTFNFSDYDLFISPDSSDFSMVTDDREMATPSIETIVIDHHETNEKFGDINLVRPRMSSCAEIVYLLFKDLDFNIDADTASLLLIGILTDTGNLRFSNDYETLVHSAELMKFGADKAWIEKNLFGTRTLNEFKLYGEYLKNIVLDRKNKFFYTGIDFETFKKFGKPSKILANFATSYGGSLEGTKLGIVILEKDKNVCDISLRGRDGFDVSVLAKELGGGGHKVAAGAQIKGLKYSEAVKKIIAVAEKYAKKAQ